MDAANEELDKFLEGSKATREAERRAQLKPYLEQQAKRLEHAKESKAFLQKTLQDLKDSYNKNFHDMAVKNTVSGFDEIMGTVTEENQEAEETEDQDKDAAAEYQPPTADQAPEEEGSPDCQFSTLQDEAYTTQRDIGRLHDLLVGMKNEYNTEYNDEAVLKAIKIADDFELEWDTSLNEFKGELPIDIPVEDSDDGPEAEKFKIGMDYHLRRGVKSFFFFGWMFENGGRLRCTMVVNFVSPFFFQSTIVVEHKQSTFDMASDEEREVGDKIKDIEKKQRVDFGPDGTFVRMMDECFEFKEIE